jgi:methyl-accepting chemotaxis protein
MNIRSTIILSIVVGAVVTALAVGTIFFFNTKSIVAVSAIISVFCAVAAFCGLLIADSVTKPLKASVDEASRHRTVTASTAKRNADITNQAKSLANKANAVDAAVKRMAKAVNRIKASADKNAKIIKRVNHMAIRAHLFAFQTTIKASCVGKTGNGLVFIADEVRDFARRCSVTAKNAADMIEESVKEADDGVKLVEDAAKSIGKIVDAAAVKATV